MSPMSVKFEDTELGIRADKRRPNGNDSRVSRSFSGGGLCQPCDEMPGASNLTSCFIVGFMYIRYRYQAPTRVSCVCSVFVLHVFPFMFDVQDVGGEIS